MKKIFLLMTLLLLFCCNISAQTHLTFMGIPITGTREAMMEKLKAEGFTEKTQENEVGVELKGKYLGKDVWFPNSQIAVEVKPSTSPDSDVLRGLFQCVKYKATLDAEAAVMGEKPQAKAILVIGGHLSKSNQEIQRTLGISIKCISI